MSRNRRIGRPASRRDGGSRDTSGSGSGEPCPGRAKKRPPDNGGSGTSSILDADRYGADHLTSEPPNGTLRYTAAPRGDSDDSGSRSTVEARRDNHPLSSHRPPPLGRATRRGEQRRLSHTSEGGNGLARNPGAGWMVAGEWRNGRRAGFRSRWAQARGGSTPPSPTHLLTSIGRQGTDSGSG